MKLSTLIVVLLLSLISWTQGEERVKYYYSISTIFQSLTFFQFIANIKLKRDARNLDNIIMLYTRKMIIIMWGEPLLVRGIRCAIKFLL